MTIKQELYTKDDFDRLYKNNEVLETLGVTVTNILDTIKYSNLDENIKFDGSSLGIIIYENRYIIDKNLYQDYENQINKNNIKINEAIIH